MPIRPEMKRRYPANWPEIRARIRARSGDRCEWCGVGTGAYGYRLSDGTFVRAQKGRADGLHNCFRIVLTVAHIYDHSPENCDEANLAHLCQRCHNRHDGPIRAAGRRERRALAAGQAVLFSGLHAGQCAARR